MLKYILLVCLYVALATSSYAGTVSKTYTFVDGTTASAAEVNTDFDTLYTLVNGNLDNDNVKASAGIVASKIAAGTFAAGTYSFLGSTLSSLGTVSAATSITTSALVATTADINAGTFDGIVGGTTPAAGTFTTLAATTVSGSPNFSNGLKMGAGQAFYLDGGSNTYIEEGSADRIDIYAGGVRNSFLTATALNLDSAIDLKIQPTKKIYLDGGSNTYITESSADNLRFYVGGAGVLDLSTSMASLANGLDFSLVATKKFYLDGGSNTYITERTADAMTFYVGGTSYLEMALGLVSVSNSIDMAVQSGRVIYLDGGGNTYLQEIAADYFRIVTAGTETARFNKDSGILLPDIDPPVANYGNRNSMVKSYCAFSSAGVIQDSYNCGVSKTATGTYQLDFPTHFASTNYTVVATPLVANANDTMYSATAHTRAVDSVYITVDAITDHAGAAAIDLSDQAVMVMAMGDE